MSLPSAVNWTGVQNAIAEWVGGTLGEYRFAWAAQSTNPPQLQRPFVVGQILDVAKAGEDSERLATDGLTRLVIGQRVITVQLSVFADYVGNHDTSALGIAARLRDSLLSNRVREKFASGNLAFQTSTPIRSVPQVEQSQFIDRAIFDMRLGYGACAVTETSSGFHVLDVEYVTNVVNNQTIVGS